LPTPPAPPAAAAPRPAAQRRIWLDGWQDVPVRALDSLGPDTALHGPALLESPTTTVLLAAGDSARRDPGGWLEIRVGT
jgi:N-methylhydantoinase A/oxoprolinase/acetone carboxylase beta subunit